MKNSHHFIELFQWTGKLPAYGVKNKSGQLAEKKPAYGPIKKRPIAALISVNSRDKNKTRATV